MSNISEGVVPREYVDREADVADFILKGSSSIISNPMGEDLVNSPPHYNYGNIEVIDYIEQVTDSYDGRQAYLVGNIIKYVSRAPHKNGAEDIRKAIWYAERLADSMEREGDED